MLQQCFLLQVFLLHAELRKNIHSNNPLISGVPTADVSAICNCEAKQWQLIKIVLTYACTAFDACLTIAVQ